MLEGSDAAIRMHKPVKDARKTCLTFDQLIRLRTTRPGPTSGWACESRGEPTWAGQVLWQAIHRGILPIRREKLQARITDVKKFNRGGHCAADAKAHALRGQPNSGMRQMPITGCLHCTKRLCLLSHADPHTIAIQNACGRESRQSQNNHCPDHTVMLCQRHLCRTQGENAGMACLYLGLAERAGRRRFGQRPNKLIESQSDATYILERRGAKIRRWQGSCQVIPLNTQGLQCRK